MDITMPATKRKVIDIPEDVFRYLSIKAATKGQNLKNYIEGLLAKDVEDMEDAATYAYLSETKPDGHTMLSPEKQKEFEQWLGVCKE